MKFYAKNPLEAKGWYFSKQPGKWGKKTQNAAQVKKQWKQKEEGKNA